MIVAPSPDDAANRLEPMRERTASKLQIGEEFKALVKSAALVCDAPIALIVAADHDGDHIIAYVGLSDAVEAAQYTEFCARVVPIDTFVEIPDVEGDIRFAHDPLTRGEPCVRFYASAPVTSGASWLGTICVIDRQPRRLTAPQREVLGCLATATAIAMEGRRSTLALAESEARYRSIAEGSSDMSQCLDLTGRRIYVSPAATDIFGRQPEDVMGTHPVDFIHLDDRKRVGTLIDDIATGRLERGRSIHRVQHGSGSWVWVETQFRLIRDKSSGAPLEIVSNMRDITEREQLQRQLGHANHSLRLAEEIAHVGHWRVQLSDNLVSWSDEVYRIHGRDPQVFRPTIETAIAAYHPDDRDEVSRRISDAVAHRRDFEFSLRIVRPDGALRHVVCRGLCEVDPQTDDLVALFGVFMDVTELAEAERDLKEKSALLQTTLDAMDQALVKVAGDGSIELVNRRFGELIGGSIDAAAFTSGIFEQRLPNGTVLEVRTMPVEGGAFVRTYADITARRAAEAALRDSEAEHRVLAETTNDVVTRLGLDMKRQYVSPASRRILGYEPEEMLGTQPSASIHPDDAGAVRRLARRLTAGEIDGDRAVTTYRARHKAGHWVWLEAGMNLVRDTASGAPVCLTCTLRDVTERQRTARHLEQARAAAEQAAVAKAEFLANMSHELRTPLTGMLGVHDLLRTDPNLSAHQHRLLSLASDAGQSLLAIVNDVLDFSKIDAGQLQLEAVPFALPSLLEGCCALASEGLGGKPVTIHLHPAAGLPGWVVGDQTRLRQIVLNLLTNAVKFTAHGAIQLDVAFDPERSRLKVGVTDPGIGIAAEKIPLLFDRFSQADASTTRRYGGTGLGLAICKRLVGMMAGTIGVDSVVGRGSTFWFELPLQPHNGGLLVEEQATEAGRPGRRVLLAEDNDINREIIATMLSQKGYHVTTAADGAEAVDAVRAGGTFDLILMDLQMPVMDGLTATATIRADTPGAFAPIPIIGLTANAMAEDVGRCLAAGMDAHVAKPVSWPALFATIERLLVADAVREPIPAAASGGPEIDETVLEELLQFIGSARLARMLRMFEEELRHRLDSLDGMTVSALAEQAHALAGTAGHFGLVSLSRACSQIEVAARRNEGLDQVSRLREAVSAAARAVKACRFTEAA